MGGNWEAFVAHNLDAARSPDSKIAGRLFHEVGLPRIPSEELERIDIPVTLIWGRHDRANRLAVAEAASARHGWPLHVIDDAADDPMRDQPARFVQVLHETTTRSATA
jgi:pimeloyl-ACP methyl ester carboxylesterase